MKLEREDSLINAYRESREKIIYFVLAASGSAIAFAMTQTKVEAFQPHHYIWLAAICFWATSFLCGIKALDCQKRLILTNAMSLRSERVPPSELKLEQGPLSPKQALSIVYEQTNKRFNLYERVQLYTLLIGALVYISWHVVRMLLNIST
ncbi:hypothetical protein H2C82_23540 [Vibrio parahaemolyticus]|uniref:hypothetical protein n=1 Tax=Vibrio parahaemolyticus TaxID=670 RepID=UPI002119F570|nr:hypothetical protein [Vibrio parahaemolyticus]MCQ9058002.1 hypothetical protein [Vibrio parahaemolyticus]